MVLEMVTANRLLRLGARRFPSSLTKNATIAPMFGATAAAWNPMQTMGGHRWMSAEDGAKHRNIGISAHIDR